jgi:signal transduction histidine kinase
MIPFAIAITLMTVIFIFGLIGVLILAKAKQNKKRREYLLSLIEEKERTMYSISLEVHDNLTQMLSVARLNLHMLADEVDPEHVVAVNQVGKVLDKAIVDTHNISHSLNPDYLKNRGLLASLEDEVNWVNTSRSIRCSLLVEGGFSRMESQMELMLFRMAQEAIQNALKHSEATEIIVKLAYSDAAFRMTISDNGKGFDVNDDKLKQGVGMLGMRHRAKIAGGAVDIFYEPGKGTRVEVTRYE